MTTFTREMGGETGDPLGDVPPDDLTEWKGLPGYFLTLLAKIELQGRQAFFRSMGGRVARLRKILSKVRFRTISKLHYHWS